LAIADAPQKAPSAAEARATLAAEWAEWDPQTPEDIAAFYRDAEHQEADLDAFHEASERQGWTRLLLYFAGQIIASVQAAENPDARVRVIDIGSGAGHDLRALRDAYSDLDLYGVEPNLKLRARTNERLADAPVWVFDSVEHAPIETADLLNCVDVLEHLPDPEAFTAGIASRAMVGAMLIETSATFDIGTPLHLACNRGWLPGRCLEEHGWEQVVTAGRLRVWRRMGTEKRVSTALILCCYRSISQPTHRAIVQLLTHDRQNKLGWREHHAGEAGINRARSIMASRWWKDTADDVFLMLDDDITFEPEDAERLVTLCREGHDVIAAAYPVRDGGHIAMRTFGAQTIDFGPKSEPVEVRHASTGFFAVHRRVLNALIPTLPLCHANMQWSFWPIFDYRVVPDEGAGGFNYLSEDYNFCELARSLGFKVWIDPSIRLGHLGQVPINIANMHKVHAACFENT
jgi:hypothetical protein